MLLVTDLLGQHIRAEPKAGWIADGGEPIECSGIIRAIAVDRGFTFILEDKDGYLRVVQTMTYELKAVSKEPDG